MEPPHCRGEGEHGGESAPGTSGGCSVGPSLPPCPYLLLHPHSPGRTRLLRPSFASDGADGGGGTPLGAVAAELLHHAAWTRWGGGRAGATS